MISSYPCPKCVRAGVQNNGLLLFCHAEAAKWNDEDQHDGVMKWKKFLRYWLPLLWVTGGFTAQRPVTRRYGVVFYLRLNKRFYTQPRRRWFYTPSCLLWRHCNGNGNKNEILFHQKLNHNGIVRIPRQKKINFAVVVWANFIVE